jgi:phage-related protein
MKKEEKEGKVRIFFTRVFYESLILLSTYQPKVMQTFLL